MYRWVNLRGVSDHDPDEDGEPLGEVTRATDTSEPKNRPDSETITKHFVMVHGYNVSENASRAWGSEMFKRLYQLGMKSKYTMVCWTGNTSQVGIPGVAEGTADYWENVTNAFITAPHFKTIVSQLPGTKIVTAHSLGNMVVSSAIVDWGLPVEKYFMLDAAVALEAYDSSHESRDEMKNITWAPFSSDAGLKLWASYWHKLFPTSDNRSKLTWKGRFGNIPSAVNYYSSGEEVLENGTGLWPNPGPTQAWVNQEMSKGRTDCALGSPLLNAGGDVFGGWGFNTLYGPTEDRGHGLDVELWSTVTLDQALAIPEENLKAMPFFSRFQLEDLMTSPQGNAIAGQYWPRAKTLAESIPALSFPAGSNPIASFAGRNVDLMTLQDGWPNVRPVMSASDTRRRWYHGDAREVAMRFNHKLFEHWNATGGLK